jgi:hypothetical protein
MKKGKGELDIRLLRGNLQKYEEWEYRYSIPTGEETFWRKENEKQQHQGCKRE